MEKGHFRPAPTDKSVQQKAPEKSSSDDTSVASPQTTHSQLATVASTDGLKTLPVLGEAVSDVVETESESVRAILRRLNINV